MTEEEAKTKLCPIVTYANHQGTTEMQSCIASGCMAWRRGDSRPESGYCGLAGRP